MYGLERVEGTISERAAQYVPKLLELNGWVDGAKGKPFILAGWSLGGALSYANASRFPDAPYFPLTGPFNLSVGLIRTDTFEAYKFIYKLEHDHPTDAS